VTLLSLSVPRTSSLPFKSKTTTWLSVTNGPFMPVIWTAAAFGFTSLLAPPPLPPPPPPAASPAAATAPPTAPRRPKPEAAALTVRVVAAGARATSDSEGSSTAPLGPSAIEPKGTASVLASAVSAWANRERAGTSSSENPMV
jgi:hypothetical protein